MPQDDISVVPDVLCSGKKEGRLLSEIYPVLAEYWRELGVSL